MLSVWGGRGAAWTGTAAPTACQLLRGGGSCPGLGGPGQACGATGPRPSSPATASPNRPTTHDPVTTSPAAARSLALPSLRRCLASGFARPSGARPPPAPRRPTAAGAPRSPLPAPSGKAATQVSTMLRSFPQADRLLKRLGFEKGDAYFFKQMGKGMLCTYALFGAAWFWNETSPLGWWTLKPRPKEE
ncbi:translation initiation factor IF-2-like [Triticum aestivum]|uniref:translation initiation factor IF-2-like n=1 Tax=Triticum aestivum TaxID=4565 RepID=UPI001D01D2D5|nr:translation initiation factor IF-2-like [Triticum aestivum]